jgi:protein-S-isoprenylcysteine O-methyltransferase Ste14
MPSGSRRPAGLALAIRLVGGVVYSVAFFGLFLFLPAWTLRWSRAWAFLGVVFVASSATMFGVFPSRPDLLEERYKAPIQKGQPLADKILTPLLVLSFAGQIVFIPLDVFRFRLLGEPTPEVAGVGLALFVAGWTVLALALRENAFAAPVVKHQEGRAHVVVDSGPYGVVRHPMYAGALPLMIGMALFLGSVAGALVAVVPVSTLVLRVLAEERLLRRDLPGYDDYARRVRWRLVPRIW